MNGTIPGRPTVQLPSDAFVDFNLAVTVVFTIVSPSINGLIVLLVLASRQLRNQPYQLLFTNYLASTVAIIFGIGIYRIVQIQNYKKDGFVVSADKTNCGLSKFLEFPIMTSRFCLFLIGYERFVLLKYNKIINRLVQATFISLPWAFGIYRYSFELTSSESRYLNIPYSGLCIDISSERQARRTLYTIFNLALPLFLAALTNLLAYRKLYIEYRNITKNQSFSGNPDDEAVLQNKKKVLRAVAKTINMAIIFVVLSTIVTTVTSIIFNQVGQDGRSLDFRNTLGTVGFILILLETVINPVVFILMNQQLQQILINFTFMICTCKKSALELIDEDEMA